MNALEKSIKQAKVISSLLRAKGITLNQLKRLGQKICPNESWTTHYAVARSLLERYPFQYLEHTLLNFRPERIVHKVKIETEESEIIVPCEVYVPFIKMEIMEHPEDVKDWVKKYVITNVEVNNVYYAD